MLKYRLIFGILMGLLFVGLLLVDGWIDGSLSGDVADSNIQGTLLAVLLLLLSVPAQLEMRSLVKGVGAVLFTPLAIAGSAMLAMSWYIKQFAADSLMFHYYYVVLVSAFLLLGTFFYQARRFGTAGTIINCGVNYLSMMYLGFLSSFVLGIRIEFGLWTLLMFMCVVKSSDIGAYAIGRLFGKHKIAPKISPGKTWEGLGGAVLFAVIVSVVFVKYSGIMPWPFAVLFGGMFGVFGQLGDLVESMIKRDAQQKDSSNSVPGFGGVLDIIDSPLATAPIAYAFFLVVCS
ncbi:MAG: phosphatidate cytidylyltransferase [Anaerohalosphaera sp.]|nr:phosphatidate cytidylyltransferase [Anaerohalosphaera sp.]